MGGFSTKKENQQSGSTTETRSQSENFAQNTAFNEALNQSTQQSFNQAGQQATSQTSLYGGQAPFLQSLWGQANALSGSDPGIAAQARNAWGQALGAGINPGVADVIANASADMGLNFNRNTLPGIRQGAVGTGSLGGSRQGIAEGLAAGELARNQSNMATTLYTQALDQASRERTAALSMSGAMQGCRGRGWSLLRGLWGRRSWRVTGTLLAAHPVGGMDSLRGARGVVRRARRMAIPAGLRMPRDGARVRGAGLG